MANKHTAVRPARPVAVTDRPRPISGSSEPNPPTILDTLTHRLGNKADEVCNLAKRLHQLADRLGCLQSPAEASQTPQPASDTTIGRFDLVDCNLACYVETLANAVVRLEAL